MTEKNLRDEESLLFLDEIQQCPRALLSLRYFTAEVDYVSQINSYIVPIEVKAGRSGHRRSLRKFMDEKKVNLGVTISQSPLNLKEDLINLPFYLIDQIPRIIKELKH
jgi:predicted AAA+ superfamily ATPase